MEYLVKKVAAWEIKIGQIRFYGKDNIVARELFKDFIGKTFTLHTFESIHTNVNFNVKSLSWAFTLACSSFIKKLEAGQLVYMYPGNNNTVYISNIKPDLLKESFQSDELAREDLLKVIAKLTNENLHLRELNSELFQYKDQLDKIGNLDPIFNDEAFMEDWLVRNLHKALPDLEIVERQPSVVWPDCPKRSRYQMDFFCLDKSTREFVVVENKVKKNAQHIEKQYIHYKAWVKENLETLNRKYADRNLKATRNFKFVVITDTTSEKLEKICNSEKIPLIYIQGGISFFPIVPYTWE